MTDAKPNDLRRLLERQDLTMEELVETADSLVKQLAPKQTRYKVTERPDARTIRYYITQQLLPKPLGYDGGRARYGGAHVLRLLLIKRMQAEHNTLSRIGRVLDGATDTDVIAALTREEASPRDDVATEARPAHPHTNHTPGRVELAPGGSLELPDDVLRDPEKRKKLAASLEAVAHWLRNTEGEDA